MKKFRKIMAILVAAMMIVAMAVPAWAAGEDVHVNYRKGEASISSSVTGTVPATADGLSTGNGVTIAGPGDLALSGYYFAGWKSYTDDTAGDTGNGVTYLPGEKITEAGTYYLYAQWALGSGDAHESSDTSTHTITIENGVDGQGYNAYKIFDVTLIAEAGSSDHTKGFAYTIKKTSQFFQAVTGVAAANATATITNNTYGLVFKEAPGEPGTYVVTSSMDQANVQALANYIHGLIKANASSYTPVEGSITNYASNNKTINVTTKDGLGYYFVDSSTGSICSLDTTNEDVTIYEKNSTPSLKKFVEEDDTTITVAGLDPTTSTANKFGKFASADIGQQVRFKLVVNTGSNSYLEGENLGNGVASNYVITDKLVNGMSFTGNIKAIGGSEVITERPEDFSVKVYKDGHYNGENSDSNTVDDTWELGDQFGIAYANDDITITLKQSELVEIGENATIELIYKAKIDKDATIGLTGNVNRATLSYTGDREPVFTYTPQETTVYVSAGALYKFKATDGLGLANAQFTMKTPESADMVFIPLDGGANNKPAIYMYSQDFSVGDTVSIPGGATYATPGDYTATSTLTTPASGSVIIIGLDTGTYTLTETGAPSGYNLLTYQPTIPVSYASAALTSPQTFTGSLIGTVTCAADLVDDYAINTSSVIGVENTTSAELPSTGGMGTTVLYIVGGMLVILAGAYLFFSRKRTA